MRKNIHAFTEFTGAFPAYISVNKEVGGKVSITVRSSSAGEAQGQSGYIELTPQQICAMAKDILAKSNGDKK